MALRVLERARYGNLVTVAAVKDYLRITASTDDAVLAVLADSVSRLFESEIGRPLARQRYAETFPLSERLRLLLTACPVDPDLVTVEIDGTADSDFSVEDDATGVLYRAGRWNGPDGWREDGEHLVEVTYTGGYVSPDAVQTWATGLTLSAGQWLRPTTSSSAYTGQLLYQVTTAGATGSGSEPTWPTTAGQTIAAGTATVTARTAEIVPASLQALALYAVQVLHQGRSREAGMTKLDADGFSASWAAEVSAAAGLPEAVCKALASWRFQG